MNDEKSKNELESRDADAFTALGIFLVVLSAPVLLGTWWAEGAVQTVVNLAAGTILLAIGVGMCLRGRRR